MIPALVTVFSVVCFGFLLRRHHTREHRRELHILKRHAASYAELDKQL
jgi:hypothetical protein